MPTKSTQCSPPFPIPPLPPTSSPIVHNRLPLGPIFTSQPRSLPHRLRSTCLTYGPARPPRPPPSLLPIAPSSHAAAVLAGAWWRALHQVGDMGGSALGQRGGWGCAHHWTGEAGCFFYGNIVLGGEHRVLVPLGPPNTQYAILDKPNPYYVLCIVCYILPLIKKILNEN